MWDPKTVQDLQAGDVFSRWGRIFAWNGSAGELLDPAPSPAEPVKLAGVQLWPIVRDGHTLVLPIRDLNMRVLCYRSSAKGWTTPPSFHGELQETNLRVGRPIAGPPAAPRHHAVRRTAKRAVTISPDRPWQEIPYSNPMLAFEGPRERRQVFRRRNGQFALVDNPVVGNEDRYDPDSDPDKHFW